MRIVSRLMGALLIVMGLYYAVRDGAAWRDGKMDDLQFMQELFLDLVICCGAGVGFLIGSPFIFNKLFNFGIAGLLKVKQPKRRSFHAKLKELEEETERQKSVGSNESEDSNPEPGSRPQSEN